MPNFWATLMPFFLSAAWTFWYEMLHIYYSMHNIYNITFVLYITLYYFIRETSYLCWRGNVIVFSVCLSVCLSVCAFWRNCPLASVCQISSGIRISHKFMNRLNLWIDFYEIFWRGGIWPKEEAIRLRCRYGLCHGSRIYFQDFSALRDRTYQAVHYSQPVAAASPRWRVTPSSEC